MIQLSRRGRPEIFVRLYPFARGNPFEPFSQDEALIIPSGLFFLQPLFMDVFSLRKKNG